jgi:hypothetical protein
VVRLIKQAAADAGLGCGQILRPLAPPRPAHRRGRQPGPARRPHAPLPPPLRPERSRLPS